VASTIPKKVNITPGRTLGKCHLATGASQEKTPRARGALRGLQRSLACQGTQTHVPVFPKSRVHSVFLYHLCLKAAWRLLQLCVAALAVRCWALGALLGALHPRTYSGALTRTRHRRSFCALCSCLRVASTIPKKVNITPGRMPGKCHLATGLTGKNASGTRRAAWASACPGMPGHPNPRARVSEVPSALGLPPSPLPQSSLAPSAAVCCRSCG